MKEAEREEQLRQIANTRDYLARVRATQPGKMLRRAIEEVEEDINEQEASLRQ